MQMVDQSVQIRNHLYRRCSGCGETVDDCPSAKVYVVQTETAFNKYLSITGEEQ